MHSGLYFIVLGLILSLSLLKVRTRKFIGALGENEMAHKLKRLNSTHYTVFSGLLLPSHGGRLPTTQIDHLVISTYGIFCIETKTRSGRIEGSAGDKYWRQYLRDKQYEFYNPLRQNYGHMKAVEKILGTRRKAPIISLVAFTMTELLDVTGSNAVADTTGTMAKLLSYQTPVYTPEERRAIVQVLEAHRIRDRAAYRSHVRHVKAHRG